MSKMTESVVVLHGGGTDSHVLAWQSFKMGAPEVHLIWFDLGLTASPEQRFGVLHTQQRIREAGGVCHFVEIDASVLWENLLGPMHQTIGQFNPALPIVSRTIDEVEEQFGKDGVESYADVQGFGWIPGRNAWFILNAAIYAAARGIYRVMWAMESEIQAIRDSRWQDPNKPDDMWFGFLDRMNKLLVTSIGHPVELVSPYMHFSKLEVVRLGLSLGMTIDEDFANVWSCEYDPRCWKCEQCHHMIGIYNALGQYPTWFPEEHKA